MNQRPNLPWQMTVEAPGRIGRATHAPEPLGPDTAVTSPPRKVSVTSSSRARPTT